MFDSILIANRGEIACRIIRTARRLGLRTIAVYSDVDAGAMHVSLADEAYNIGPAPARESYLSIDKIIGAVRASGAASVHPGYGFLSENAEFAEACVNAGAIFIGPPANAIRAMGSKSNAKAVMEAAHVPLAPGYHGEDQDLETLSNAAAEIGYPVLIKASAGGGGRGMRRVDDPADFEKALEGAKRESASAFGDDTVLVEKFITRPRHIEMQIFADSHGNVVHLFERDCSLQRRHQKVIEEAPAPGIGEAVRAEMGAAAIAAAQAIGYVGAGTVEFIVEGVHAAEPGHFFFMEMNTRLQVEHPVTEIITGVDLVAWQIQIAAGDALPMTQDELTVDGHAVEVRLYAENPARKFLPQTGRLDHLVFPPESAHVRVDTGVRAGDEVSMFYDPMIAKIVTWDRNRDAALRRMRGALSQTEIVGVTTNRAFLAAIAAHPAFLAAELETGFIETYIADLTPDTGAASPAVLAIAGMSELLSMPGARPGDPSSPWDVRHGWRMNGRGDAVLNFKDGETTVACNVQFDGDAFLFDLPTGPVRAGGNLSDDGGSIFAIIDGARVTATVIKRGAERHVIMHGQSHVLRLVDPMDDAAAGALGGSLTAPMPGSIVAVHVAAGDSVRMGQPLMAMEAMKMEHTISAPAKGVVEKVKFAVGDQVVEGDALLVLQTD
ncbi:MAG: 3-methylcrotonyl-CoA carboxylase alpha subunit [Alphaproteobacteria bacterium]|jgi:3-methylcrotonyl-CoA carboxylase alpha subunit